MDLHRKRAPESRAETPSGAGPTAVTAADAGSLRHTRLGGPTRRAAQKRRVRAIVDAAVALANEGGFDAVRTRDICERAGVSMSTLYREFESKEEIILHAFGEDLLLLEAHFAKRPAEGATPLDRVDAFFRVSIGAFFANANYARAAVASLASGQNRPLARLESLLHRMTRLIGDALVGPASATSADAARDAIILHRVWFALVVGWSAQVYSADDVLSELRATTARLLSGDSGGPLSVTPRVVGGE